MENKPSFAALTPEQVNGLIAEKIMGSPIWKPNENGEGGYAIVFHPWTSNDHCLDALMKLSKRSWQRDHPMDVYIECLCAATGESYDDFDIPTATRLHLATPKQKCEAMLRAIGEVE